MEMIDKIKNIIAKFTNAEDELNVFLNQELSEEDKQDLYNEYFSFLDDVDEFSLCMELYKKLDTEQLEVLFRIWPEDDEYDLFLGCYSNFDTDLPPFIASKADLAFLEKKDIDFSLILEKCTILSSEVVDKIYDFRNSYDLKPQNFVDAKGSKRLFVNTAVAYFIDLGNDVLMRNILISKELKENDYKFILESIVKRKPFLFSINSIINLFTSCVPSIGFDNEFILKLMGYNYDNPSFILLASNPSDEMLKNVLLHDYFPVKEFLDKKLDKRILKLEFTQDELSLLRCFALLDSNYLIFFNDELNINRVCSMINECHDIYLFLERSWQLNSEVIKALYKCGEVDSFRPLDYLLDLNITTFEAERIVEDDFGMYRYLPLSCFSHDKLIDLVTKNPSIIDYFDLKITDGVSSLNANNNDFVIELLVTATKNGYDFDVTKAFDDEKYFIKYLKNIFGFVSRDKVHEIFITYFDNYFKNTHYVSPNEVKMVFEEFNSCNINDIDINHLAFLYACPVSENYKVSDEDIQHLLERFQQLLNLTSNFISFIPNVKEYMDISTYNTFIANNLAINLSVVKDIDVENLDDESLKKISDVLLQHMIKYYLIDVMEFLKNHDIFSSLVQNIAHKFLALDFDYLLPYLDKITDDDIAKIRDKIAEGKFTINFDERFIDYVDLICESIRRGNTSFYHNWVVSNTCNDLVYDSRIIWTLLERDCNYIKDIPRDVENYREYVKYAVGNKSALLNIIDEDIIDDEIVTYALTIDSNALFNMDPKYWTMNIPCVLRLFCNKVFSRLALKEDLFPVEKFKLLFSLISEKEISETPNRDGIFNYVLAFKDKLGEIINDPKLGHLYDEVLKVNFKGFMSIASYEMLPILSTDNQVIVKNALDLIKLSGKVNIGDSDLFTYRLISRIVPVLGLEKTLDLISYDSGACDVINNLIMFGKGDYINDVIKLNECYCFVKNDDKCLHYLFNSKDFEPLFSSIIMNIVELTAEDVKNIRNIILNNNIFSVESYEELKSYNQIISNHLRLIGTQARYDNHYLDYFVKIFGFKYWDSFKYHFQEFNLNNFRVLNTCMKEIKKYYGEEVFKELMLTKEEVLLIKFLEKCMSFRKYSETRKYIKENINKIGIRDYTSLYYDLVTKIRKVYSLQLNLSLSRMKDVEKKVSFKVGDVPIYEITDSKYDFLAHLIHNFDMSNNDCFKLLNKDLTLWDRLDGSSSISMSTYSNDGNYCISNYDGNIYFLFDEVSDDFLLYMNHFDLGIDHGKNIFNPSSQSNSFTTFEALKQRTAYMRNDNWNEVAGNRVNLIPAAILVTDKNVSENIIKASQYFSKLKGEEVPIIYAEINKDDDLRKDKVFYEYRKAKIEFRKNPSYSLLKKILYPSKAFQRDDMVVSFFSSTTDDLKYKAGFIIDSLTNSYNNNVISFEMLVKLLRDLLKELAALLHINEHQDSKIISKIDLIIKMLCYVKMNHSDKDIVFEIADLDDGLRLFDYSCDGYYYSCDSYDYSSDKNENVDFNELEKVSAFNRGISRMEQLAGISVSFAKEFIKINQEIVVITEGNDNSINDRNILSSINLYYKDGKVSNESIMTNLVIDYLLNNHVSNFFGVNNYCIVDSNLKEYERDIPDANGIVNSNVLAYVENLVYSSDVLSSFFGGYTNGEYDIDFSFLTNLVTKIDLLTNDEYLEFFREYLDLVSEDNKEIVRQLLLSGKHNIKSAFDIYINSIKSERRKKI